jgi:hypothetical protein
MNLPAADEVALVFPCKETRPRGRQDIIYRRDGLLCGINHESLVLSASLPLPRARRLLLEISAVCASCTGRM